MRKNNLLLYLGRIDREDGKLEAQERHSSGTFMSVHNVLQDSRCATFTNSNKRGGV